jgi:hypothetical protein
MPVSLLIFLPTLVLSVLVVFSSCCSILYSLLCTSIGEFNVASQCDLLLDVQLKLVLQLMVSKC